MVVRPTYIELCAGIGGISIALERCGLEPVCRVERDAYAASVLVARMEDSSLGRAPIWDDLTTFDGRPWRGGVDLVAAGFPCQPFSLAGKRLGEADERAIWPEIERIVRECEPAAVFLENVRPEAFLGPFLGLRGLGFRFAPLYETSAHEVGAPHLRVRYFALAYCDGDGLRRLKDFGIQRSELSDVDGRDSFVGDTSRSRLEERRPEPVARPRATAWPPGPADECGWREWITSGGPQPVICRGANGVCSLVDRLRCLGNAVVPDCAERAFRWLMENTT